MARPGGPYTGAAGNAIQFNGQLSRDPDGTITKYQWDFGDGSPASADSTLQTPKHTYTQAGTYTARLTVTDNNGATGTATTSVTVALLTDGLANLSYDPLTNRINTAGFTYDDAGNLTRGQRADGVWQRFQYDAAGRLVKVKSDNSQTVTTFTYGDSRQD